MEICQKGDQLLDEEIAKVYKGKKINKGKFLFFFLPQWLSRALHFINLVPVRD